MSCDNKFCRINKSCISQVHGPYEPPCSKNVEKIFAPQVLIDIVKDLLVTQSKLVGHTEDIEINEAFNGIEDIVSKVYSLY